MVIIKIFNGSDCLVYESEPIPKNNINDELIKLLNDLTIYEDDKIIID